MEKTIQNKRRDLLKRGLSIAVVASTVTALQAFQQADVKETGKMVKLLSPEGEIIEIDEGYLKPIPEAPLSTVEAREGIPGKRFVMVIDLAQCKNLRKCHDACEKVHHCGPDNEFLKILKMQDNPLATPFWQPTMCAHCDQPPCVKVCPVDATFKRTDGIVLIDTDRCIGCRFCMVACPYSARTFSWSEPELTEETKYAHYSPETSFPAKMGTVSKCDFCPDQVRKGEMPHCVSACPNGVYYFGDENEDAVSNGAETVRLSELLRDRAGYRFMEDLGTRPRVYYLPPVNRAFKFEDDEFTNKNAAKNGNE